MLGLGVPELILIGVVLLISAAVIVGIVLLVILVVRRSQPRSAHLPPTDAAMTAPSQLTRVLGEIAAERARQDARWGEQNHPDGTGPDLAVLGAVGTDRPAAEVRDLARDHCDTTFGAGEGVFRDILTEEVLEAYAESDPAALRAELVQVAAVAVSWIEAIDRRG